MTRSPIANRLAPEPSPTISPVPSLSGTTPSLIGPRPPPLSTIRSRQLSDVARTRIRISGLRIVTRRQHDSINAAEALDVVSSHAPILIVRDRLIQWAYYNSVSSGESILAEFSKAKSAHRPGSSSPSEPTLRTSGTG